MLHYFAGKYRLDHALVFSPSVLAHHLHLFHHLPPPPPLFPPHRLLLRLLPPGILLQRRVIWRMEIDCHLTPLILLPRLLYLTRLLIHHHRLLRPPPPLPPFPGIQE